MVKRASPDGGKPGARRRPGGGPPAGGRAAKATDGSRAVPGKAPRGSFHAEAGGALTSLGRLVLDRLDRGIILIDDKGGVLDANLPALRVLNGGDGIALRNGRLTFSDAAFDQRFVRLIAQQRSGAAFAPRSIAARFRRPSAQSYLVVVSPVPPHTDERNVVLVAFIYAPNERREISAEVLKELYGLTRAQAEVARRLFTGRSVEQTAEALQLSLNTVRTHLKHIFTKSEVQSQAELMHLLAQGPGSL
jgi:DNA-binding CsgD family transcriptional regulator